MDGKKRESDKVRRIFGEVVKKISDGKERVFIERRGKKIVVMLPIDDARLLEMLENVIDIEEAQKVLADAQGSISLDELIEKYGRDPKL